MNKITIFTVGRDGGLGGELRRTDQVCVLGGQADVLLAVRHGGELPGVVRVPATAGRDRLAPDHTAAVAVHRENHERRHRPVPAGRAQTSVAVSSVSHVSVIDGSMNKRMTNKVFRMFQKSSYGYEFIRLSLVKW